MTLNKRFHACAFIRTKKDYYKDAFNQQDEQESATPQIFWCGKTFVQFGPDGEEATIETCQKGRSCFCESIIGHAIDLEPESPKQR
jgi:hypothetical protein